MKKIYQIAIWKICLIIVFFLFIIGFVFGIFKSTNKKVILKNYVSKMELLQEKTNFVRNEYKLWENYNPNETGNFYTYLQELGYINANSSSNIYIEEFKKIIENLNSSNLENWNKNTDTIITNYCYFSSNDLKHFWGIDNIKLDVIINFYTGNIISRQGIYDGKKIIYRQYDTEIGSNLTNLQIYNNEIIPEIEIVENYGLEQKIRISLPKNSSKILQVYYYLENENNNMRLCSKLKNYSYVPEENAIYFNINKSGKYTFIVEDVSFVQYSKIVKEFNLCNPPILLDNMMGIYWDENGIEKQIISVSDYNWYNYAEEDFRMANAKTEDGNYWVWIPRYIFKETIEGIDIEFVSGNTNIATNNKSMAGYKIHEAFSENENISGFWMSKFQVNIEENKINIKPGKTLSVLKYENAKKYNNMSNNKFKIDIMSDNQQDSAITISKAINVEIVNDLVYYAGGSPNKEGFKENIQYSSSNNIYGIYDLLTSENELTKDSNNQDRGRWRLIIIEK